MNPSEGKGSGNRTRSLRLRVLLHQLTPVMVQPQRGQSEPVPDRQVVPQLEQVLAVPQDEQPFLPAETGPQAVQPPFAVLTVEGLLPSPTVSKAQED